MASRLSKNTFARLFPAMKEPDISSAFLASQEEDEPFVYDENEYSDKPGPMQPPSPTRPSTPFQLPQGAFSPAQNDIETSPVANDMPGADPLGIDTLVRIGEAAKAGRSFASDQARDQRNDALLKRVAPIDVPDVSGPPDIAGRGPALDSGTGSDGRPYRNPADEPPPALPTFMQPKPVKSAKQAAEERVNALRTTPPVDKDTSVKGRVWEAIANALEGMSMAWKQNPKGHWAGILAGGATGAAVGGTLNRTWNEQRQQADELEKAESDYKSLSDAEDNRLNQEYKEAQIGEVRRRPQKEADAVNAKMEMAQAAHERRVELARVNAELRGGKVHKTADGKVWTLYPDGRQEPLTNPTTGEQEIDPGAIYYETTTPVTGQKVRVKGNTLLGSESTIEASQVGAANKTGENWNEYQSEKAELDGKIAEATTRIKGAKNRLAQIEKLEAGERYLAADEVQKLQKVVSDSEAELAGYQTRRKGLPTPRTVQGRSGDSSRFTEKQAREYYSSQGKTPEQINALVSKGRQQGIIY